MIATFQTWLHEAADLVPILAGVGAFLGWMARRWRRWMTTNVSGPINDLATYARYHLGPNGESAPLHQQVKQIDSRLDILEHRNERRRNDDDNS